MNDFIDLTGASGTSYRFRLWRKGVLHPPMAGNYACLRRVRGKVEIMGVGASLDLSRLAEEVPKRVRDLEPAIYTRLNVARVTRTAEHEDLLAAYGPVKVRETA